MPVVFPPFANKHLVTLRAGNAFPNKYGGMKMALLTGSKNPSKLVVMTLSVFVANTKRQIYEELISGQEPTVGTFDPLVLKECRLLGQARMGTTVFSPDLITFEFIFAGAGDASMVFPVKVASPQRIVYLPVPAWVIENIWQGNVDGSHHFESDAAELVAAFQRCLEPANNAGLFGPKPAKRRE